LWTFTPVIKIGDLEIDILKRTVHTGASELHVTSLEQSLLYQLAANAGRAVTCEEILDALGGVDYVAESNIVDRQIRNLRKRLHDDWREPRFIATVPGHGYCFYKPSLLTQKAVELPEAGGDTATGDLGSCLPRPPVRSGRAQFRHPAPQITDSLRNARSSGLGWPAATGGPA